MEKQQIIDRIIDSLREEIIDFVETESTITDSVKYEERVLSLSREFARKLTIETQGEMPKSRNSKKKS